MGNKSGQGGFPTAQSGTSVAGGEIAYEFYRNGSSNNNWLRIFTNAIDSNLQPRVIAFDGILTVTTWTSPLVGDDIIQIFINGVMVKALANGGTQRGLEDTNVLVSRGDELSVYMPNAGANYADIVVTIYHGGI